jgi:hypothetical protein
VWVQCAGAIRVEVKSPLAPVATVRAPESAMLLVVKVWEPITVPEMKVPMPALEMRVVAPVKNPPAVATTLPAVAVMSPVAAVIPVAPVMAPTPVISSVGVSKKVSQFAANAESSLSGSTSSNAGDVDADLGAGRA